MRYFTLFNRYFTRIASVCASIAALLFVLAGAMLTYEVIARYFFSNPTIWASELSQLCLIWGSLLGMSWLLHLQRHIRVDAVAALLPVKLRSKLDTLAMLFVAILAGVVLIWGFEIFYDSFERGRTTGSLLNLPSWIAELAVPMGFALLLVQSLLEMREAWQGRHNTVTGHDI